MDEKYRCFVVSCLFSSTKKNHVLRNLSQWNMKAFFRGWPTEACKLSFCIALPQHYRHRCQSTSIRGFTTMRYINLRFTYFTYLPTQLWWWWWQWLYDHSAAMPSCKSHCESSPGSFDGCGPNSKWTSTLRSSHHHHVRLIIRPRLHDTTSC